MAFISIHYPLELASHPDVLEVSVVARNHIKWGERPMAFVVLHPQQVSSWKGRHNDFAKELKAHAKERLPGFACPEWVEVVQELPVCFVSYCNEYKHFNGYLAEQKTSTGKILKTELRKIVSKL